MIEVIEGQQWRLLHLPGKCRGVLICGTAALQRLRSDLGGKGHSIHSLHDPIFCQQPLPDALIVSALVLGMRIQQ
jgi:hypothetical protein